jgi:uncharacterized protein
MKCLYILIFVSLTFSSNMYAKSRTCDISILNNNNIKVPVNIELAVEEADRNRGLMFRNELGHASGMLFVFEAEEDLNFWMKNTYIPLSIAYIDKKGIIKEIHDMKPLDISITYPSSNKVMYALEVNQGWFELNNIKEGSKIILNGCIGK